MLHKSPTQSPTHEKMDYPIPHGMHPIPPSALDLRPDAQIDTLIQTPPPVTSAKNIWFFWHAGYANMHGYAQRTVRAYHRRLTKKGWTIRVIDNLPGSPNHISNFVDTSDPRLFPKAFREGTIAGTYALQHTSDLVRWPLLNTYGGVYTDVGMMQIGDLDRLWNLTVENPESPWEILSYSPTGDDKYSLTNYFLGCLAHNPLFERCHALLLKLWDADGGRTSTEGMHASPLLRGVPLMGGGYTITEDDGTVIGPEEVSRLLTDYIIQGQVVTAVMGLVDQDDSWDGPRYSVEHVYNVEFMSGSQYINEFTGWDGKVAFELMSLPMPREGEEESEGQRRAREIVEACLTKSFGFKLAHGLILRTHKVTLGSAWRDHPGSDVVPGTYAAWLRFGMVYWEQDEVPVRIELPLLAPTKVGRLLE
ncbi:hypothetical protein BJY04DRAFT_188243 [Aspergillus karnatakaensis]|uniref:uncharacterized protein n=1 Tax=Aspergillus karnatakaensis TaxID=1810916 RepID=UPI003CCCF33C